MAFLEIPFAYRAEYVARGRQVPRTAWILDSVPVRVAEASPADAPVAARMTAPSAQDGAEPTAVAYRMLDGRMVRPYHPYNPKGGRDVRTDMSLEDAQADLALWPARARVHPGHWTARTGAPKPAVPEWFLAYAAGASGTTVEGALGRGEVEVREWLGDDRAARRAVLTRALDGRAAVVGGVLHVPSLGPAWAVGREHTAAVPEYGVTRFRSHVFRGDHGAQAFSGVERLRRFCRLEPNAPRPALGTIEILDAVPFASVPSEADAVADTAFRLCRDYAPRIGLADADTISLFADARRLTLRPPAPGADLFAAAAGLLATERRLAAISPRGGAHLGLLSEGLLERLRETCAQLGAAPAPRGP